MLFVSHAKFLSHVILLHETQERPERRNDLAGLSRYEYGDSRYPLNKFTSLDKVTIRYLRIPFYLFSIHSNYSSFSAEW